MLSVIHTIISLPLAEYLHSWFLIFVTAVLLHLLADTTLHWNIMPNQFKRFPYGLVFLDVAAGLILAWLLVGKDIFTLPYLAAIVGGNITDLLHVTWDSAPKYHSKFPRILKQFFFSVVLNKRKS